MTMGSYISIEMRGFKLVWWYTCTATLFILYHCTPLCETFVHQAFPFLFHHHLHQHRVILITWLPLPLLRLPMQTRWVLFACPFIDIILTTTILQTTLNGYVGFDTITQQIEKKLLKRGFQFNVMVVGNVNCFFLSCHVLLTPLFSRFLSLATQVRRVSASRHWSIPSSPRISLTARVVSKQQNLHVKPQRLSKWLTVSTGFPSCPWTTPLTISYALVTPIHMPVIEEHGVRLRLNIVDTPGYGDQVNNENWYVVVGMGGIMHAN